MLKQLLEKKRLKVAKPVKVAQLAKARFRPAVARIKAQSPTDRQPLKTCQLSTGFSCQRHCTYRRTGGV